MSVHDELRSLQRCLDDLRRCVGRVERELGDDGGLEIRRVRLDTDRLRESVALLNDTLDSRSTTQTQTPTPAPAPTPTPAVIYVPDTPYDPALWADADDEGVGTRYGSGRHPHGTGSGTPT